MEHKLAISKITGYLDTNPTRVITTWGEFLDSLRVPVVRGPLPLDRYLDADKLTRDRQKDGPAIIAGTFSRPGTRLLGDFESMSMMVLDLDDSYFTFEGFCERLKFEAGIHTSYTNSQWRPRYRGFFPLKKPITGQIKPVLERIIDYFDEHVGHLDPVCRKPAQLYYAPACPPGGEALYQFRHISGNLLDPADFPAVEPSPRPRSQQSTGLERTAISNKPGDKFNARANWADLLEPLGWSYYYQNHWTRPGKKYAVSASILDAGFYVHSSDPATAPFVSGRTYTLFGAYAAIHHGGDHSAAARELRRLDDETSGR